MIVRRYKVDGDEYVVSYELRVRDDGSYVITEGPTGIIENLIQTASFPFGDDAVTVDDGLKFFQLFPLFFNSSYSPVYLLTDDEKSVLLPEVSDDGDIQMVTRDADLSGALGRKA